MNYPINQWIELESFEIYRDWKTPRGFLCGTYASSVLLAYWNLSWRAGHDRSFATAGQQL